MTSEKDDEVSASTESPSEHPVHTTTGDDAPAAASHSHAMIQTSRIVGTGFIFFATWGVASSFSAYQAFYQQHLLADHSPSTISWIGTVQVSLLGFTGLVSGALYDRGYIRPLLVIGGVLSVLGFMMLSLSKQYYQVILTQGVCIGLGESYSETRQAFTI
jgi:MFS family permease